MSCGCTPSATNETMADARLWADSTVMPGSAARPAAACSRSAHRWASMRSRPICSMKPAAEAMPIAPATLGVPPSSRAGSSAKLASVALTQATMSPP
ncbi:hypothetical protein FQZ97_1131640 [compost metagenome]